MGQILEPNCATRRKQMYFFVDNVVKFFSECIAVGQSPYMVSKKVSNIEYKNLLVLQKNYSVRIVLSTAY